MDYRIYNSIGLALWERSRKDYAAGIASVTKKNRKLLLSASTLNDILNADDRDLFKVDYSVEDTHALHNMRIESFTVAGIGSYQLEEKLKSLFLESQRNGQDIKQFEKEAQELIRHYSPDAQGNIPAKGWLRNNYTTAQASAFGAAQWIRLQDPALDGIYMYVIYKTRKDSKVRPKHAGFHDKVYRRDDPILLVIWAPNDWNCRCFMIPMDADEIEKLGLSPEAFSTESDIKRIVKEMSIPKEFQRNAGYEKSIWDKWIKAELKNTDLTKIESSLIRYADSIQHDRILVPNKDKLTKRVGDDPSPSDKVTGDNSVTDVMNTRIICTPVTPYINEVIKTPHEVWGKTFMRDGVMQSVQYYVKFSKDGTLIGVVRNGILNEIKLVSQSKESEYRRGMLIYKDF